METVHNKRENQQRNLTVESCNDGQGVRVSTGAKKILVCYLLTFLSKGYSKYCRKLKKK